MKRVLVVLLALVLVAPVVSAQQVQFPYISTDATPLKAFIEGVSTTSQALFAAGGAGVRNFITQVTCLNTTTTALAVDIYDGATPGTKVTRIGCPASSANSTVTFTPPLKLTANTQTNLVLATTNAGTQAVHVTALGFKSR